MTSIVQDGIIWKDAAVAGVWTAFIECLGVKLIAYAIEVDGDGEDQHAATEDGASFLRAYDDLTRFEHLTRISRERPIFRLGDVNCVLVLTQT